MTSCEPASESTQYEAYTIRPRQTAQVYADHTACEVGFLGIVDGDVDDDRMTGASDGKRLFENRLHIGVAMQGEALYPNSPTNGGQVIVRKLTTGLLSQSDLLKLRNLGQLTVAQDQHHYRQIQLARGEQFQASHQECTIARQGNHPAIRTGECSSECARHCVTHARIVNRSQE